jgi:hypothetical protein
MKTGIAFIFGVFFKVLIFSQVSITTTNYTQNFGTTSRASWTDNSTYPGWYLTAGGTFSYGGTQNITTSAPTNTGGFYTYQCNGGGNIKLGSRPSNTSGGSSGTGQSHIGLRLVNNTGQTIESIEVIYRGYQLSLAENGAGNTNSLTFSYRISTTANTSLTSGTWTSVASLNYDAPNNSSTQGSNQVSGYPCTVSSAVSSCVNTASIANGSELMLRWSDVNNTYNDHHLAIDDVEVKFNFDNACAVTLPVELLNFDEICENNKINLEWSTASERNNDFFIIEASKDGVYFEEIQRVQANGNTSTTHYYSKTIENQNYAYIKLKQRDFDGMASELGIISLDCKNKNDIFLYPNPTKQIVHIQNLKTNSEIILMDATGKIIVNERNLSDSFKLDMSSFKKGVYIIQILNQNEFFNSFITLID